MSGNAVFNPRFADDGLSGWSQSGAPVHIASDGSTQLGCVELAGSQGIEQQIILSEPATYTFTYALKSTGGGEVLVTIENHVQATVWSASATGTANWAEQSATLGLSEGNYKIKFDHSSGATLRLDDVSLAHIPATRREIATRAHAELATLATEFGLSTSGTGDLTEGDYTYAIDATLIELSYTDEFGEPDVRCMSHESVAGVVSLVVEKMLATLHNRSMMRPKSYAIGPVKEDFEVTDQLATRLGIKPGQGKTQQGQIHTRRLTRRGW